MHNFTKQEKQNSYVNGLLKIFSSTCHCLSRCDARKRCYVPAMNTVFSDPCAWTYKYLDVHLSVSKR